MNISKALKLCRTQKGITKTKLAEKADISISYLSLLEQGKRDPNLSTINNGTFEPSIIVYSELVI